MSTDKQIGEMANEINEMDEPNAHYYDETLQDHEAFADCFTIANHLYEKGYRKASEVAEEIFAEIEKEIDAAIESNYRAKKEHKNHSVIPNYDNFNAMCDGKIYAMRGLLDFNAELKKKYTEGGE